MTFPDAGLLILRLVVGGTFAAHGAQKAFGWWSGPGWTGWQAVVDRLKFRPIAVFAILAIVAELGGGLLLALGLLTPLAVAMLLGQSIVIVVKIHLPRGFWNRDNGIEFPLSLAAGVVAIGLIGPGALSIDGQAGLAPGDPVRLAAIVVGLVGGFVAMGAPALAQRRQGDAPATKT
jgi:putative oxidoreductase